MTELKHFSFYGLKVSSFQYEELVNYLKSTISEDRNITCYGYSLGIIPYIRNFPIIYMLGEDSDVMVTDGRLFFLLLKVMKYPVFYEISIPGLSNLLLKLANQKRYSIMLLGGTNNSNKRASENIKNDFPNIMVLEGIHGYFNEVEEDDIIRRINCYKPNILLIGISSPKKDEFTVKYKKVLKPNIVVPCGGMIEIYAGNINEIPKFLKKFGLASLFRVAQEPRRLIKRYVHIYTYLFFYFIPNFIFKVILLKSKTFSIPRFCKIK